MSDALAGRGIAVANDGDGPPWALVDDPARHVEIALSSRGILAKRLVPFKGTAPDGRWLRLAVPLSVEQMAHSYHALAMP